MDPNLNSYEIDDVNTGFYSHQYDKEEKKAFQESEGNPSFQQWNKLGWEIATSSPSIRTNHDESSNSSSGMVIEELQTSSKPEVKKVTRKRKLIQTNNPREILPALISAHNELLTYRCNNCDHGFRNQTDSLNHVQKGKCDSKLKSARNPPPVPFKCQVCNDLFSTKVNLQRHIAAHGSEYKCSLCAIGFKTSAALGMHHRRMHKGMIKCFYCNVYCISYKGLEKHLKLRHPFRRPEKATPGLEVEAQLYTSGESTPNRLDMESMIKVESDDDVDRFLEQALHDEDNAEEFLSELLYDEPMKFSSEYKEHYLNAIIDDCEVQDCECRRIGFV